jgi:hypothetical protein
MPREPTWGTPGRSEHYMALRPLYRRLLVALALGFFTCGFGTLLWLVGWERPVAPGRVASGHSGVESRCLACHDSWRGASDLRCQRCHDSGGAGRLSLAAHVFFGSGDVKKAEGSGGLECARCHVEHRGAQAKLSDVDERQCLECHASWRPTSRGQTFRIGSFGRHPEFQVLRDGLDSAPGMMFSHKRHMREMIKDGAKGEWESCTRCHVPQAQGSDFDPVSYEAHCARCHSESELVMDPVPAMDVVEAVALRDAGGAFERSPDGATLRKLGLRHKDPWVLFNLRKLQAEAFPAAYARDRNALLARASGIERRLFQAEPLVGLSIEGLRQRRDAVAEELRRLEGRLSAQTGALDAPAAQARLDELVAAALASGDETVRQQAEAARQRSGSADRDDLEARRRELLATLDALAAAEPARARTVEDLRRRLMALRPGETSPENLQRALRQRRQDLARLADEIRLREKAIPAEVRSLPERVGLEAELKRLRDDLANYYQLPEGEPLSEADLARKRDAIVKLTGAGTKEHCAKCHLIDEGSLARPRPAKSLMVRAVFAHRKHLVAPLPQPGIVARVKAALRRDSAAKVSDRDRYRCAYCHEGIVAAIDPPRKPAIPPVQSCRECHASGATRADCQLCHRYHPPGTLS